MAQRPLCGVNTPPCADPASVRACCAAPSRATNWHGPGFRAAAAAYSGNQPGPTSCIRRHRPGTPGFPSARPRHPRQVGRPGRFATRYRQLRRLRQQKQAPARCANRAVRYPGETTAGSTTDRKARGKAGAHPKNANAPTDRQPEGRCVWSRVAERG